MRVEGTIRFVEQLSGPDREGSGVWRRCRPVRTARTTIWSCFVEGARLRLAVALSFEICFVLFHNNVETETCGTLLSDFRHARNITAPPCTDIVVSFCTAATAPNPSSIKPVLSTAMPRPTPPNLAGVHIKATCPFPPRPPPACIAGNHNFHFLFTPPSPTLPSQLTPPRLSCCSLHSSPPTPPIFPPRNSSINTTTSPPQHVTNDGPENVRRP